ncbi:hypothetical protein INT43_005496 [Umbelopsis isabellina]|uniref:Actin-like ATPase domain-containing protein n=1 Tax=Mortierella isabellina TaxID=91625 RepID=A0A8H7PLI2_MORIS|nr:hypothetical protein INT43_005496 [Umbelopsis isabellina]
MLPVDSQFEITRPLSSARRDSSQLVIPSTSASNTPPQTFSPIRGDKPAQSADMSNYKIVLGYDFGTTFSGASYAYCQNEEILDVQRWPQKKQLGYPKVPTVLLYEKGSPPKLVDWGHGARKLYAKPGAAKKYDLLTGFKLNLDENLDRPSVIHGIPVATAIADYLSCLHKHVVQELGKQFARNYTPEQFRYCLTVPAMWSDRAKAKMRTAAIEAGLIASSDPLDRLMITSEPEAGAIYCEKYCQEANMVPGDRFMICDAGGGTVDLIVFEIEEPNEKNSRLKEITKGMGESCGSIFLDQRFQALLEEKLGSELERLPPSSLNQMMDNFIDTIKPEFDGVESEEHYLALPASIDLDVLSSRGVEYEDDVLVISGEELKYKVFDPVVNNVIDLIRIQLDQVEGNPLKTIFLVGGFGSSGYLYNKVKATFEPEVSQILYPSRAALAIVRGAVLAGLHPQPISTRISRRTYGINAGLPFDLLLDSPNTRFVRPDGSVRCITRFLPFAHKGDAIPVDQCIREQMYIYYNSIYSTDLRLYATEEDQEPRYYDQPGVKQVAAIEIPIPILPGVERGQRVGYEVRMYFGRNEIRMEAEFPGGNVFAVNCDFDALDIRNTSS